jgi:hypothetical protein
VQHNHGSIEEAYNTCLFALEDTYLQTGSRRAIQHRLVRICKKLEKPDTYYFHLTNHEDQIESQVIYGLRFPSNFEHRPYNNFNHFVWASFVAEKTYSETARKALYRDQEGNDVTVENLALQFWVNQGWKGYHSENSVLSTLFGMLFWDILFDDSVPGVFSSPFQDCPLDLRTEFFYESRREAIDQQVKRIDSGEFLRILEEVDDRERPYSTRCRGNVQN